MLTPFILSQQILINSVILQGGNTLITVCCTLRMVSRGKAARRVLCATVALLLRVREGVREGFVSKAMINMQNQIHN
jgi:hypothetical protein